VQRLDELAGNDKGGRSGLIRQAIDEYLERHAPRRAVKGSARSGSPVQSCTEPTPGRDEHRGRVAAAVSSS
jgi:hypothetical protein